MKCRCIVFDLDGTIYFGDKLADKANEVIQKARKGCDYVFFVTNNSAKTRNQIYNKLIKLGVDISENELINSGFAIAKYLKIHNYKNVLCIGTPDLKREISDLGINFTTEAPQAIVVGYNKDFKLDDLIPIVPYKDKNCELIIANKEHSYPGKDGIMLPGAGPIVSAVEFTLNKTVDVCIGKPNSMMLEIIVDGLNLKPDEICVVGDSYESDVQLAKNYGANSILITNKDFTDCKTIKKLEELLEIL